MTLIIQLTLLLLLPSLGLCHAKIDMVKDYIINQKDCTIAIGFFCNKTDALKFAKFSIKNVHFQLIINGKIRYISPSNKVIYVVDANCNVSTLLEEANSSSLFASPFRWLLITNNEKSLSSLLYDFDVLIDCRVSMAVKRNDYSYAIKKLYKLKSNLPIIYEMEALWNEKIGYVTYESQSIMAVRRKDLQGIVINTCLVVTNNDTLQHLLDKRDKHIDTITKVNYVFMLHLMDMLNITMNFSIVNTWGYKQENGTWSGMIGKLTTREAEIGGTALFMTSDRVDIIDYITMPTPTRSKFIFRQPKLSYVTNVFTLPFNTDVWLSSIAMSVILAIALFLVNKWEWRNNKQLIKVSSNEELHDSLDSFSDVSILVVGAVCQQGAHIIPRTASGRLIILILFVSVMFLYTSYSAFIVALLQTSSSSIRTLRDLLNSRLQVGVDDTVFNRFYFPNATEPVRKALYVKKVAPPGQKERFYPIDEGVRRIRDGFFAFHMETGPGYKIVSETFLEHEKCELQEISFLQVPDPWLAIRKNSSFKEILKISFRMIQESGIQSREVSLLYTKKPECETRTSSFITVGIVDCYPALVVLGGGIIVSLIVLIVEYSFHYRNVIYKTILKGGKKQDQ